jgi:hypothetical protein
VAVVLSADCSNPAVGVENAGAGLTHFSMSMVATYVAMTCAALQCGSCTDKPALRSEHQSVDGWIVLEKKTVVAISIRLLAGSALRAPVGVPPLERLPTTGLNQTTVN